MINALNPNHKMTQVGQQEAAKLLAILLHKYKLGKVMVTDEDIINYPVDQVLAVHGHPNGIELYLVDMKEAQRLAKQAGGMPC